MKRKRLLITIGLYAIFITVVFVFQGMIFPYLRISGFAPLILPLVSTGFAVNEGRFVGGVTGIFSGILCDMSLNQPVGAFTVLLTFTGLFVGTLADTMITRGYVTYLLFCMGVLAISAIMQMVPLIYIGGIPFQLLLMTAIWQTVYSLIFTIPIWFFVRSIGKRVYRESAKSSPQ